MSIKDKPLKKCHSDTRITLDVIHTDIINKHKKNKNMLTNKLNDENKDTIEEQIDDINNNINEYYLDNGFLLNDYYNKKFTNKKEVDENNILNYFKNNVEVDIEKELINTTKQKQEDKNKQNIITKYLSNIDDKYLNDNLKDVDDNLNICLNCGNNNLTYKLSESEVFCSICGFTETVLFENDKTSYKDNPKEITYFAYKRINHFNELIAQFQGKESTDIPNDIYTNILKELKKNKNIDMNDLTIKQMREILKKLKYNKYYENINTIITVITGNNTCIITRENEDVLRNMFKEIQLPFMKHCPSSRKNFLSYSYVLYKFCELLELNELLKVFSLLKSREKLQQQDMIWKNICKELQWEFIPSI